MSFTEIPNTVPWKKKPSGDVAIPRMAELSQPTHDCQLPGVSVVIPCKGNEDTIRAAVDSILVQDYPMLRELILIGSPDDPTWTSLIGLTDSRLSIMETATPPGIRDANFKRDFGIRQTSADLICLLDSDMVIPPEWLSTAVTLLTDSEVDCVAGVMCSIRDDFWGRFVDTTRLGAKTPRAEGAYFVTAKNFGVGGRKPPITANILFTREMYLRSPIDPEWSHGSLEDYEWFWRVVASGHHILVSNSLYGWHHHRTGFRKLSAEYRRSARGCAYFIRTHSRCPFARKRLTQAVVLPLMTVGAVAGWLEGVVRNASESILAALMVSLIGVIMLSGREFIKTRTLESLIYPLPALVLGINYTASLARHLIGNVAKDVLSVVRAG